MDGLFEQKKLILNADNFEQWEDSMKQALKQINAWTLIKKRVGLEQVENSGSEKDLKTYAELCLKVEYLLKSSTEKEDRKLVRDNTTDNIFTAWHKLIAKYEPFRKSANKEEMRSANEQVSSLGVENELRNCFKSMGLAGIADQTGNNIDVDVQKVFVLVDLLVKLPTTYGTLRARASTKLSDIIQRF